MKVKFLMPIILFFQLALDAQQVTTLLSNAAVDNLTLDSVGNIYGSGFTTGKITRITPAGVVTTYATIVDGLGGSVFDKQGNLFIGNYNNGNIYKVLPNGNNSVFVNLGAASGPAGLAMDGAGNIYAACSGNSTTPLSIIKKITPSGVISDYSTGVFSNYFSPGALVFDAIGNLYVSNYANGNICKITPTGTISVITTIPNATNGNIVAYMALSKGFLYVCHAGGNRIYKINIADNTRTVFAGTGTASSENGSVSTATFNGPNGIVATPNGNTLYVSEYLGNNLRTITNLNTSLFDSIANDLNITASLNKNILSIKSNELEMGKVSLHLFDISGKELWAQMVVNNEMNFDKLFIINGLNRLTFYFLKIENNGRYFTKKLMNP